MAKTVQKARVVCMAIGPGTQLSLIRTVRSDRHRDSLQLGMYKLVQT